MSEEEPKEAVVKSMSEEEMASKSRLTAVYPAPADQMSDKQMLHRMFSIFSPSSDEHAMIAFVTNYLRDNKIKHSIDSAGNIYFNNHVEGNCRILLNAHMDTVASAVANVVIVEEKGKAVFKSTNNQVIGGDDKCGVFAVLKCITDRTISTPLMGMLNVSEEIGLVGSDFAMDHHSELFKDVVFCITVDRRGNTEIITKNSDVDLCSDDMEKMLDEWGKDYGLKTAQGSISDVSNVVKALEINGINLFAGYYGAHSGSEYVVFEELLESVEFIKFLAPTLHKYFSDNPDEISYKPTKSWSNYPAYGGYYGYNDWGAGHRTQYSGLTTYGGGQGVKVYETLEKLDHHEALDLLDMLIEEIEDIQDNYFMFDSLRQADTHMSSTGKSLVITNGYQLFFTEMKELDEHLRIYDGAVMKGNKDDAVINITDLQAFEDAVKTRKTAEQFDVTWDDLDDVGGATD